MESKKSYNEADPVGKRCLKNINNSNNKKKKNSFFFISRPVQLDEGLKGLWDLTLIGQLVPFDGLG